MRDKIGRYEFTYGPDGLLLWRDPKFFEGEPQRWMADGPQLEAVFNEVIRLRAELKAAQSARDAAMVIQRAAMVEMDKARDLLAARDARIAELDGVASYWRHKFHAGCQEHLNRAEAAEAALSRLTA